MPFYRLAQAEDWPQWLGTNRDAEWREEGIIARFPKGGPKLRWESKLGAGYSGPAVAEGRVFVMDRLAAEVDPGKGKLLHDGPAPRNINFVRKFLLGKERLLCLNEADGKLLWERTSGTVRTRPWPLMRLVPERLPPWTAPACMR